MWARTIVITRCIGSQIGGIPTSYLAGIGDALGHKGMDSYTEWSYKDNEGAFIITITKKLQKDQPIYISFGRKCNSRFFVNYGMVLEFNQDNQVLVSITGYPQLNDPLYSAKKEMVKNITKAIWQIAFEHKERITKKFMSFFTCLCCNKRRIKIDTK